MKKKVFYQSQFLYKEFNSLREIVSEYDRYGFKLIFDTNLCIYLRDLYLNPLNTINRLGDIWPILDEIIFTIKHYNLDYDYVFGLDESCRNKSDYSLNINKAMQTLIAIESILQCDYFSLKEYINSNSLIPPIKDNTDLAENKSIYYKSDTVFGEQQRINYPALLKIFLIDQKSSTDFEKIIEFLSYYDETIDLVCPNLFKFAYMYFGRNKSVKKMLHPKRKSKGQVLHGIWNCATDISIYHLTNQEIENNKLIPIFVTFDEGLYTLNKSSKVRIVFAEGSNFSKTLPPLVEIDLSEPTNWSKRESKDILLRVKQIDSKAYSIERRMSFDPKKISDRLYNEVIKLELEI